MQKKYKNNNQKKSKSSKKEIEEYQFPTKIAKVNEQSLQLNQK